MSHDRGCWKCGKDIWEYNSCEDKNCVKSYYVQSTNKFVIRDSTVQIIGPAMEDTTKICKNCKHYHAASSSDSALMNPRWNQRVHQCHRRLGKKIHLVTGETVSTGYIAKCEEERGVHMKTNNLDSVTVVTDICGPSGIYYVEKEKDNATPTQKSSSKGKTKSRK